MTEKSETDRAGDHRKWSRDDAGASSVTARRRKESPEEKALMEAVVSQENMRRAYARVVGNKGAAGVDGMSVEELKLK